MLRLTLAWLHLIALGIGLAAVWARHRALRQELTLEQIRRAIVADTWWGVSAAIWIATGVWRVLGETEKAMAYYLGNPVFHAKMGTLLFILVLEVGPMLTLIGWRRGKTVDERAAHRVAGISLLQTALILAMSGLAVAMARGYGG